jgi:hypothetical protein
MFSEYSRILIASILAAAFLHSIRNKENSSSALESPGFNVGHSRAFFQQNSQTREIDIDLHDKHDRHGNQNSEINMYEHLKVKPDGNLNVVNTMQHEQQVNLHASPQDNTSSESLFITIFAVN